MSSHFMPLPRSSMISASSSGDHLLCFLAGLSVVCGGMLRLLAGDGAGAGPGPIDPRPPDAADPGLCPPPPPGTAPAGAYPPPPRKGYAPGGGYAGGGAAYRVPTEGATLATECGPPKMAAAGAKVAVAAGLEESAAACTAAAEGGGAGTDEGRSWGGCLGGESEDSFESGGTLRRDLISTVMVA